MGFRRNPRCPASFLPLVGKCCYCIRLSDLSQADMANNQDSGLFSKTSKTDPGSVHAFLSHSWRDDPARKWQRMLEYKAEHESEHAGEEPTCWLDKACIDQAGDIDESLKVLPLFLLFSQRFVVFAGKSYTKRMWCVLEMFTFLRSGGHVDRIILKPLDAEDRAVLASFDIRKADCFLQSDKQRLLAIVESSYFSFGAFNNACRNILMGKLRLDEAPSKSKPGNKYSAKVVPGHAESEPESGGMRAPQPTRAAA